MQAVDDGRQQQIRAKREVRPTYIHTYIHTHSALCDLFISIGSQTLEKEKQEGQLFAQKFLDEAADAIQRWTHRWLRMYVCMYVIVL